MNPRRLLHSQECPDGALVTVDEMPIGIVLMRAQALLLDTPPRPY